jgi:hypothetical protein
MYFDPSRQMLVTKCPFGPASKESDDRKSFSPTIVLGLSDAFADAHARTPRALTIGSERIADAVLSYEF